MIIFFNKTGLIMTNFSDSYCEIKADLPRDFEIYREILKANL